MCHHYVTLFTRRIGLGPLAILSSVKLSPFTFHLTQVSPPSARWRHQTGVSRGERPFVIRDLAVSPDIIHQDLNIIYVLYNFNDRELSRTIPKDEYSEVLGATQNASVFKSPPFLSPTPTHPTCLTKHTHNLEALFPRRQGELWPMSRSGFYRCSNPIFLQPFCLGPDPIRFNLVSLNRIIRLHSEWTKYASCASLSGPYPKIAAPN